MVLTAGQASSATRRTAKEIVDIIRETITAYDPDNLPPDDITLLILKRNEA